MDGVWNAGDVSSTGRSVVKYRGREYPVNDGETVGEAVARVVRSEGIRGTFNVIGDGTVLSPSQKDEPATNYREILIVEKITGA